MNKTAGQQPAGTVLNGRYRIVRALGQGGMGTVYLARHEQLETDVAVKEVRGARPDDTEFKSALDQSAREARFLVRLNHPNLPKVTDAFVEDDRFYLIMEYIEGVTLEAKLWEGGNVPLPVKNVVDWGLQISDVLSYLHNQDPPIIFRDLKPANIMLQPGGEIRLIDFGIARRFHPGASKDTMLLGSVGYSPPEQFGHHQTDARSDLYAFGATLHHLLTGRDPALQPFKFAPVVSVNPAVPETLSRLIDRCVAIDPEARPRSIQELEHDLILIRDEIGRAAARASSSVAHRPGSGASSGAPASSRIHGSASFTEGSGSTSGAQDARRSVSREAAPSSGADASPRAGRKLLPVLVAVIALILLAPLGYYLSGRWTRARDHVPNRASGGGLRPSGQTSVPDVPATADVGAGDKQDVDTPAVPDATTTITVDKPVIAGDSDSGLLLRFHAEGSAKGRASSDALVVVYLFYGDGAPLPARNPDKSVYATSDGQLSVARSIQIGADESFDSSWLDLPSSEFPEDAFDKGIKYQVKLIADKRVLGATDKTDVPVDLAWRRFFSIGDSGTAGGGDPAPQTAGVGVSATRR